MQSKRALSQPHGSEMTCKAIQPKTLGFLQLQLFSPLWGKSSSWHQTQRKLFARAGPALAILVALGSARVQRCSSTTSIPWGVSPSSQFCPQQLPMTGPLALESPKTAPKLVHLCPSSLRLGKKQTLFILPHSWRKCSLFINITLRSCTFKNFSATERGTVFKKPIQINSILGSFPDDYDT